MATEKEIIEKLAITSAVEHALVKNGVRFPNPVRSALTAQTSRRANILKREKHPRTPTRVPLR